MKRDMKRNMKRDMERDLYYNVVKASHLVSRNKKKETLKEI